MTYSRFLCIGFVKSHDWCPYIIFFSFAFLVKQNKRKTSSDETNHKKLVLSGTLILKSRTGSDIELLLDR